MAASHVVGVVGFDAAHVFLNDPGITESGRAVVWDEFLAAWAEFDETTVVIRPPVRS